MLDIKFLRQNPDVVKENTCASYHFFTGHMPC